MKVSDELAESLFATCTEHGASNVSLAIAQGRHTLQATLTFSWQGQRYERAAMIDHKGLPAVEHLRHLALCVFEPEHKDAYAAVLRSVWEEREDAAPFLAARSA